MFSLSSGLHQSKNFTFRFTSFFSRNDLYKHPFCNIITFSLPVLLVLYPITICIVLITIVNKFVPLSTYGMQLTVGLVTALSLVEVLAGQFNWTAVSKIISALPLAGRSLTWLLPALVGIVLSLFLPNKQESEVFEM